jgi:hypothetical protein
MYRQIHTHLCIRHRVQIITYSKGRRGRNETFHPSIHGWHHTKKKTMAEINTPPPFAHVWLSRKCMPSPRGVWYHYQTKGGQIHPDVHLENLKIVTIKSTGKNNHCSCHLSTNIQGNLPQHPWVLFFSKEKNSPLGPPFVWPPMWRIFFLI